MLCRFFLERSRVAKVVRLSAAVLQSPKLLTSFATKCVPFNVLSILLEKVLGSESRQDFRSQCAKTETLGEFRYEMRAFQCSLNSS